MYALLRGNNVYLTTREHIQLVSKRVTVNNFRMGPFTLVGRKSVIAAYGCHKPGESRVTRVRLAGLRDRYTAIATIGSAVEVRLVTNTKTVYSLSGVGIAAILGATRLARLEYIRHLARSLARLVTLFARRELEQDSISRLERLYLAIAEEIGGVARNLSIADLARLIETGLRSAVDTGIVSEVVMDRFREYTGALLNSILCHVHAALVPQEYCDIDVSTLRMLALQLQNGNIEILEDDTGRVVAEARLPSGLYRIEARHVSKRKMRIEVRRHNSFSSCKLVYATRYTMTLNTAYYLAKMAELLERVSDSPSVIVVG